MTTRQAIVAALVIAVVCCLVMWMLEDFRMRKMVASFRAELDRLPTAPERPQQ